MSKLKHLLFDNGSHRHLCHPPRSILRYKKRVLEKSVRTQTPVITSCDDAIGITGAKD